ncbi:MAG: (2Fe-2S)-binding protein [Acidimicrobiales bacterium]
MGYRFRLDGREVDVGGEPNASLLELLREGLGVRSAKDGCSPQGQCGCCTVLVDGAPRAACVTPASRIAGRSVTTLEGLDDAERRDWAAAFCATGASQCGFCTPGIIMRLSALRAAGRVPGRAGDRAGGGRAEAVEASVAEAMKAHLCRCTGWRTIVEACGSAGAGLPGPPRDMEAAARRAELEGGAPQRVGPEVPLGGGGFAEDTAPADALVAVPDGAGGWVLGESLAEARARAGRPPGRRTTLGLTHPLEVPPGEWALTLRTTWVEPAYLEPDASWCLPDGEPASPLANGGAFGAKTASPAPLAARRLARELGRPVRVVLSREDTVRLGPKRPPVAAGVRADGTGAMRVVRTPGIADAVARVAPRLAVAELDAPGPSTSAAIRAAGWAEAAVLGAAVRRSAEVTSPSGAVAEADVTPRLIRVRVRCGDPLDRVVLRSYCIGAAHMGLSWVRHEGLAVGPDGAVEDLTIRSFGILGAAAMPAVEVEIDDGGGATGPPVNGSDAVFAAVAAAAWRADDFAPEWPTRRRR